MKKNVFKKGFTLIELMIVIVILGVLMGTILPRLTGAQARARDTGRVADLNTIAQALETYYDDNGAYPDVDTGQTTECLEPGKATHDAIAGYLKGNEVPAPPSSGQTTTIAGVTCTGLYFYAPLASSGLPNNGYVLASDMETYQNANYDVSDTGNPTSITGTTSGADFTIVEGNTLATVDNNKETDTIYVLVK